ncbi:MAG: hypothetical protein ACREQC_04695, partial [Candidatus Binataceae bacterium]
MPQATVADYRHASGARATPDYLVAPGGSGCSSATCPPSSSVGFPPPVGGGGGGGAPPPYGNQGDCPVGYLYFSDGCETDGTNVELYP